MKLRHIRIEHFRGIKLLDWFLGGDFICLVGPGDSCKSTILDAIELVFTPRWNPIFEDSDFYEINSDKSIEISATVGDLPRRLLSDSHFGLRLRGINADGDLHDEPLEGDEEVLTIRLAVDSSLEPTWEVVTDRHPDGAHINAREREKLGVVRLGVLPERHLSWSRGSVLARLTGDVDEHSEMLADANRKARNSIDKSKLPRLSEAAQKTASLASAFGVKPQQSFAPGLDPGMSTIGAGGLALHDGSVPLRRAGLGTRRLVTLAMQRHLAYDGGVILVDEVEHALEPYRVRRLLRELQDQTTAKDAAATQPKSSIASHLSGVVLMTSHSPVVLGELSSKQLRVVRTKERSTSVIDCPDEIQPLLRSNPEAFLSRRVLVCEGKTELGLLKGLDEIWSKTNRPFASEGAALADAGGCTKVGIVAKAFRSLGYPTAVFADSDKPLDVTAEELLSNDIEVALWADEATTEQRIFSDLPWQGVVAAIDIAIAEFGEHLIRQQVASALSMSPNAISASADSWLNIRPESELRQILGSISKSKNVSWFKRVDLATELGKVVAHHLAYITETDLAQTISLLRGWVFNV